MNIKGIGINLNQTKTEKIEDKKTSDKKQEVSQQIKPNVDSFVRSTETKPVTYTNTKTKVDAEQLDQMEKERVASFTKMLQSMLGKQAGSTKIDLFSDFGKVAKDDALSSIENDPVWGVDAVATRIMDMAKALSGGDNSKLEMLRDAVQKGFGAAQKEFGKQPMPGITSKTYDEVMRRFDDWAKE